jgi:polysaccharide pyruvyl transferase WcaK-like protein
MTENKFFQAARAIRVMLRIIRLFNKSDLAFMRDYDLIISAPQGPTISDMYPVKMKTLYPLAMAKKMKLPYCIIGVSMGPFDEQSCKEGYVFEVLKGACKIILRETKSLEHLTSKYPRLDNVFVANDLVFALPLDLSGKPPDVSRLYQEYLSRVDCECIGTCISLTPARSPKNAFNKDQYVKKMAEFFDHVIARSRRRLILVPHLQGDMPYLQQLINSLHNSNMASIFPQEFDSDFQQDFIRQKCEFFISTRYHPTIFAVKSCLPFMCILNQFKTEGMLQDLKLDADCCWQDDNVNDLVVAFDSLWKCKKEKRRLVENSLIIALHTSSKYRQLLCELNSQL